MTMYKYNRVQNTARGLSFGVISKIVSLLGAFLARTVLIYTLGIKYVGLDGLLSSILFFLNMAEMGFGTAIVYKLYDPIAKKDEIKICSIIKYYRKVYRIIGVVVFVIGLSILPFLNYFIKGDIHANVNIYILYLVYLLNACLTYWMFAYKTAILNAHQRNDLVSKVVVLASIAKYAFQVVVLLLFENYYLFVIVIPLSTIINNLGNNYLANKYFHQYVCKGVIDKADKRDINKKVQSLLYDKIGVAIINSSDNIVISKFLGLTILGIYDSYYYIFTALHGFYSIFQSSISAGIGNKVATETVEDNYKFFLKLSFVNFWLVCWASICLISLYKPFMILWLGVDNTFNDNFSFFMGFYFYFWFIRFMVLTYKNAKGLWWEDRFRAITEGIVNIIVNIILVKIIGIYGITLSTIIGIILISIPWETAVLFKKYFEKSPREYYTIMIRYFLVFVFCLGITYYACSLLNTQNVLSFCVKVLICIIVPNLLLYARYRKSEEFLYVKTIIRSIIIK